MFVCPAKRDAETAEKPEKEIGIVKRIFIVLVALMILLTSASLAEDLSALSDEELFTLCRDILDEMERRQSAPAGSGAQEDLPAFATINDAMAASEGSSILVGKPDNLVFVLEYGGKSYRVISMLDDRAKALYKAGMSADGGISVSDEFYEYAQTLPVTRIEELTERPMTRAEIDSLNGKTVRELLSEGYEYSIYYDGDEMGSDIGLQKGLYSYNFDTDEAFGKYRESRNLNDLMDVKVSNGAYSGFSGSAADLSYPLGETPEEEPAAGAPEISDSTVLYYLPSSLKNDYHLDPNCSLFNPDCLPLPCWFTYAELSDDMYRDLDPCLNCGAPERPVPFATLRDAMNAPTEQQSVSERSDRIILLMEKDGESLRVITMLDARAKALYAAMQEDEPSHQAFTSYAWGLPVTSVEKFTSKPLDQRELDSMSGKTIRELIGSRTDCFTPYDDVSDPPVVELSFGLFSYNFELDATREEYLKLRDSDAFWDLKVKNGTFSGFSYTALDTDGSEEP